MSGDTFDFLQGNRETLTGTLHDPAATPGDVLTVQPGGSVAAVPGGGSMPYGAWAAPGRYLDRPLGADGIPALEAANWEDQQANWLLGLPFMVADAAALALVVEQAVVSPDQDGTGVALLALMVFDPTNPTGVFSTNLWDVAVDPLAPGTYVPDAWDLPLPPGPCMGFVAFDGAAGLPLSSGIGHVAGAGSPVTDRSDLTLLLPDQGTPRIDQPATPAGGIRLYSASGVLKGLLSDGNSTTYQAAFVDPTTATGQEIAQALIDCGLMAAS